MVINEVFSATRPDTHWSGKVTLLEALRAGVTRQLAPLDDPDLTGTGTSSMELLGVSGAVLVERLISHLIKEILTAGLRGGVLAPLADQLNHDVTHAQGQHLAGMVERIAEDVREVLSQRDSLYLAASNVALARLASNSTVPGQALRLVVKDPQTIYDAVDVQAFTGREWLAKQVYDFLRERPCGYVWLEARAGLGKTAFAAWLAKTNPGWVSHFSQYTNGGLTRVALASLAGQLIEQYRLDDIGAPAGMLPQGAGTAEGFESLLATAAAKARTAREQLVAVADGLDEAEHEPGGLPWGLPKVLPRDVFVIGTYRSGMPMPTVNSPSLLLSIEKDDPRNRRDIDEYLANAVSRVKLAVRLATDRIAPKDFAAQIAERCGGVWVYLRYVLEEIRWNLRSPSDLADLPADLSEYYVRQLLRWTTMPRWESIGKLALSVLAVAREPLTPDQVARFSDIANASEVRQQCEVLFRPFLTRTQARPAAYAIYHASFAEFLTGRLPASHMGPSAEDRERLAEDLHETTTESHARIADYYLESFGGWHTGLRHLLDHPSTAILDDGYPLRHLTYHLQLAGRIQDVHRLLGLRRSVNVWFLAHDRAESLDDYLADIRMARQDAERASDEDFAAGRPASTFGLEIRYMLMTASITSLTDNVPAELLVELAANHIWNLARALRHASRLTDPAERCRALVGLRPYVPSDEQSVIIATALDAATAIRDEDACAQSLISLAPHLVPEQLSLALTTANTMDGDEGRANALSGLAPYLTPEQLQIAVGAAVANRLIDARAETLASLAPYLSTNQLSVALDGVSTVSDGYYKGKALKEMAPYLSPNQVSIALKMATEIGDEDDRALALIGLIPYLMVDQLPIALKAVNPLDEEQASDLNRLIHRLAADQQSQVLAARLKIAAAIGFEYQKATALTSLILELPPSQRAPVIAIAFEAAIAADDGASASALAALASYMSKTQLSTALQAATSFNERMTSIDEVGDRAEALTGLAPYLSENQLITAFNVATSIDHARTSCRALTGLALHMPPTHRSQALTAALKAATATGYINISDMALTDLAQQLQAEHEPQFQATALEAVMKIDNQDMRVKALTDLARHLPLNRRTQILAAALAAATAIGTQPQRDRALNNLGRRLWQLNRQETMPAAVALTRPRPSHLSPSGSRIKRSSKALRPKDPAASLRRAITIKDEYRRSARLIDLAPYLSQEQLSTALDAAVHIRNEAAREETLIFLAPHLSVGQRADALNAAILIRDERHRAWALYCLARHLSSDQLSVALDAAILIRSEEDRARTLCGLASYLSVDQLTSALNTAILIQHSDARKETLCGLAPYLSVDQRSVALQGAIDIQFPGRRADALIGLAPHLSSEQLSIALEAAAQISFEEDTAKALVGMASYLSYGQLTVAVEVAAAISFDDDRSKAVIGLAPYLATEQLSTALAAVSAIGDDDRRGEALTRLVPRLSLKQLSQALDAAPTFSEDSIYPWKVRSVAIRRAIDILPEDAYQPLATLVRQAFTTPARDICLELIAEETSTILRLGSERSLEECVTAIKAVHRWWQ